MLTNKCEALMYYDLSIFQQSTLEPIVIHYDARSPDKIFIWGVRRREKIPAELERCQLMIYKYK